MPSDDDCTDDCDDEMDGCKVDCETIGPNKTDKGTFMKGLKI